MRWMLLFVGCCSMWSYGRADVDVDGTTAAPTAIPFVCGAEKFTCAKEQKCIPKMWKCDNDDDCGDGSDEIDCTPVTCRPDMEFTCRNNKCIPKRWRCDGDKDCSDGSDEDTCNTSVAPTCQPNYFQCNNSRCIPQRWQCDTQDDCGDKSDEEKCTKPETCKATEYQCGDGSCIAKSFVCDRDKDCADGKDERGCGKPTCNANEFRCSNGQCLPMSWKCDGDNDCTDGSDEVGCQNKTTKAPTTCPAEFWRCENNNCIIASWKCDGERDCTDGSDEKDCVRISCPRSRFACANNKQCIYKGQRCDGKQQCDDGSDEEGCTPKPAVCGKNHFNCTSEDKCIEQSEVCNAKKECQGGEDEPANCNINECLDHNGHCGHNCIDDKIGYHCGCRMGYKLDADGRACIDENECQIYGKCSQLCRNIKGHYKCSCSSGYQLEPDGKTCKVTGAAPMLFFANRHDIRKRSLGAAPTYESVVKFLKGAVSIDFHKKSGYVYWTDVISEQIQKAKVLDGATGDKETVMNHVHTPDGIAIDWITDKMYWTDTGYKTIEVATLDGKHNMELISTGLGEPRAIALDPYLGHVYWSDWGDAPAIEKMSMDGLPGTRKQLITTDIVWPNGLSLDLPQNKIYWIDAKLKRMEACDLTGGNRMTIKSTGLKHPFALTNFGNQLYWTDWQEDSVNSMDKFNTSAVSVMLRGLYAPMDVKIYHPVQQQDGDNPCTKIEGGCSHLCLLANHGGERITTCACPRNMQLEPNKKTCKGIPITRGPETEAKTTGKVTFAPPSTRAVTKAPVVTNNPEQSTKKGVTDKQDKGKEVITAAPEAGKAGGISIGIIVAIVIIAVIALALLIFGVWYYKRRHGNKNHIMYYKDMSTAPLEEDFDGDQDDTDENAKIIDYHDSTDQF